MIYLAGILIFFIGWIFGRISGRKEVYRSFDQSINAPHISHDPKFNIK